MFQSRGLGVKTSVELRESLLNVVPQAGQFPFQAVFQIDNELFQIFHGTTKCIIPYGASAATA